MGKRGEMEFLLHPASAKTRGIDDGDRILVRNDFGSVRCRARLCADLTPDVVVAVGVWSMQDAGGATFEALCGETLSDIGEATTLNENRVEVMKY